MAAGYGRKVGRSRSSFPSNVKQFRRVAGLLTCPIPRTSFPPLAGAVDFWPCPGNVSGGLTAVDLSGTLTRFPFHPPRRTPSGDTPRFILAREFTSLPRNFQIFPAFLSPAFELHNIETFRIFAPCIER